MHPTVHPVEFRVSCLFLYLIITYLKYRKYLRADRCDLIVPQLIAFAKIQIANYFIIFSYAGKQYQQSGIRESDSTKIIISNFVPVPAGYPSFSFPESCEYHQGVLSPAYFRTQILCPQGLQGNRDRGKRV